MAIYDVYVKGVNPDRRHETEHIKLNVGKMFKLQGAKLDALFNNSKSTCVRRGASDVEAKKYQAALSKMGMICICKPVQEKVELSLLPMDDASSPESKRCPVCDFTSHANADGELERCEKCGLQFEKYEQLSQENQERAQLKDRIVRKEKLRQETQRQQIKEGQQRAEQRRMEEEIEQELGLKPSVFSRVNALSLAQKGVMGVLLGVGVGAIWGTVYVLNLSSDDADRPRSSKSVGNSQAGEEQYVAKPQQAGEQAAFVEDQEPGRIVSVQDAVKYGSASSDNVNSADASLQRQTEKTDKSLINDIASLQTMQNAVAANDETGWILNDSIIYQKEDQEWISYVNKHFKLLLAKGELYTAYQLSTYQSNLAAQIDMVGEVSLAYKKQGNTHLLSTFVAGLEKKVLRHPEWKQAEYYAQIAKYQYLASGRMSLFDKAYQMGSEHSDPNKRIKILGRIANYQMQAGLIDRAQDIFHRVKQEAGRINSISDRIESLTTLAKDFVDAGDASNARQMLGMAEQAVQQIKQNAVKDLALSALSNSYAYSGNNRSAKRVFHQISSTDIRASAVLKNLSIELGLAQVNNAANDLADLPYVAHQVVGNAMLAAYLKEHNVNQQASERLFKLVASQVATIKFSLSKAVAASNAARFQYRAEERQQALKLFDLALAQVGQIADQKTKDKLLAVLAVDYARVLLLKQAGEMQNEIKSAELIKAVQKEITDTQGMMAILTR